MQDFSPQDALVAIMIASSAADAEQTTAEFVLMDRLIDLLPAFEGYDKNRIDQVVAMVRDLFEDEDGVDELISRVAAVLPERFGETAYALACDIAAMDGRVNMAELKFLEILRHDLNVGRLASAAIERGARAKAQRF